MKKVTTNITLQLPPGEGLYLELLNDTASDEENGEATINLSLRVYTQEQVSEIPLAELIERQLIYISDTMGTLVFKHTLTSKGELE